MKNALILLFVLLAFSACRPDDCPPEPSCIHTTQFLNSVHVCDAAWFTLWDEDGCWIGETAYSGYALTAIWSTNNAFGYGVGRIEIDSTGHSCDTRANFISTTGNNQYFKFYPFQQEVQGGDTFVYRIFDQNNKFFAQGKGWRPSIDTLIMRLDVSLIAPLGRYQFYK